MQIAGAGRSWVAARVFLLFSIPFFCSLLRSCFSGVVLKVAFTPRRFCLTVVDTRELLRANPSKYRQYLYSAGLIEFREIGLA